MGVRKESKKSEVQQFLKRCNTETRSFESLSTTAQNPIFEEQLMLWFSVINNVATD